MALDKLTIIDGGGLSTTSNYRVGVITATKFVGPVEGSITATDATFSGNVSIGGTLTYEDVTNIDSVGVITAREAIDLPTDKKILLGDNDKFQIYKSSSPAHAVIENEYSAGSYLYVGSANGVIIGSPLSHGQSMIRGYVNGRSELYFSGSKKIETTNTGITVTGTAVATGADINGDLDVDGHTNLDNVSVAGVSTFANNVSVTGQLTVGQIASPTKITAGNPTLRLIQNNNSLSNRGYIQFFYNTSNLSARISGKARNSANGQLHFDVEKDSTLTNILLVDDAGVDITGNITATENITATGDLDVDGHTNLDNVSIAGIVTATEYRGGGSTGIKVTSAGKVLIGTSDQGSTSADELTIENTGPMGISLRTNSTGESNVYFADGTSGTDRYAGYIAYQHQYDRFRFGVNGGQLAVQINEDKSVTFFDNVSIAGVSTVTTFLQVLGQAGTSDKGFEVRANSTQNTDTNKAIRIRNNSNTDTFNISYKGKVTATELDISGNIDVDGHTNLDNVSISGITTFSNGFVNLKPSGGGNAHLRILSTGTGDAGIFFDAANGDIAGSDYVFIGQQNNLDFVINANVNAGNIDFQRAGNTQLRITAAGDVGIGTNASLTDILTVNDTHPRISMRDNGVERAFIEVASNDDFIVNNKSISNTIFKTTDTHQMVLSSKGQLGIGTNFAPPADAKKLTVICDNVGDGIHIGNKENLYPAGSTGYSDIRFSFYDYLTGGYERGGEAIIRGRSHNAYTNSRTTQLVFMTASDDGDPSSGTATEKVRITHDGDVAITTRGSNNTEGVSKVNVEIPARTTAFSASDGDTWHDILIENPGAAQTNAVGIAFEVTGSAYHKNAGTGIAAVKNGTNSDYGSDLVFITRPQSAVAQERLRITSDGDVAIGRDSAQANYAAGTDTTRLAVVKESAGTGYHEMAHFTAGSDANDTGSIVRIGHFSNDRGFFIKAGRGTSDQAKAILGLRTSSAADQDAMTILQPGTVLIGTSVAPSNSNTKFRVHTPINTSSANVIELSHNTNGANKPGAALGLAIGNGGESTNAADLFFQTANNGSMSTKMTLSAGGILRHQISKNTTAIEITTHGDGAHSFGDEARLDFLMRNEVPQSTGNPAARIASYLQRGNNGFGLRFYARTNASTLFKAMEMTADYEVLPGVDGVQDLGSTSKRWRDVYTSDLDLSNETKGGNSIDGTWGSYKIEEGEDDLFIINRRNGKKYKFNLTEVS